MQPNVPNFEVYNKMWKERLCGELTSAHTADYSKEKFQLMFTIDRFFGTTEGYTIWETAATGPEGSILRDQANNTIMRRTIDHSKPNVFAKMAELKLMLCGGTINSIFTNTTVNDLDFYMQQPEKKGECEAFLEMFFPVKGITSVNAITMRRKSNKSKKQWTAQLITRFSGHPQEIFDWFDFTITHGAYLFDKQSFEFGTRFFQDLAKRRLVYSGASQYPICAMYRTRKYIARGYECPGATIMHIALSIVQLKIENYAQLKEQLMGIDTMYLQKLLDAKDPQAPVDYGEFIYEAFKTIDRINGMTEAEQEEAE